MSSSIRVTRPTGIRPHGHKRPASASGGSGMTSTMRRLHRTQRQGDEIACSCGKRWALGDVHP